MIWSTYPSKTNFWIPPKFHIKAFQSNMLWLNLNKINEISILQSGDKQGNHSFYFHAPGSKRRYQCTQTASAVPKYPPCLLQFCSGYHIWHASRAWSQKWVKNHDFHTVKNIQMRATFFSPFLDEFLYHDFWPIYCSPICGQLSEDRGLWLYLLVGCKFGLWANNQSQDLLCNVQEL